LQSDNPHSGWPTPFKCSLDGKQMPKLCRKAATYGTTTEMPTPTNQFLSARAANSP